MKLIVFSDLHYVNPDYEEPNHEKLSRFAEPLMDVLTEKINNDKNLDAAVFLGDFIEDTGDHDLDVQLLKHAVSLFSRIEKPLFLIPGNHEFKKMGREEVAEIMGQEYSTYSVDINN